jgi:hypothetical protein
MMRLLAALFVVVLMLSFSTQAQTIAATDCAASGNLAPYCGLSNPEDLEVLPDGKGVLASDMHITMTATGIVGQPGTLKLLNPKTRAVTVLYPSANAPKGRNDWGDASCASEIGAALLPHGFHLSKRNDGAWQLLVVNHGERESVEYFQLINNTSQQQPWSLRWRGCVVPPPPNRLNDVAGLADGSLLVTTMHRLGAVESREAVSRAQQGENTGFLWRWRSGKGIDQQPGSESPRPNGVQVDAANRYAYINTAAGGGEVRKLDLHSGKVVGAASVVNPDNASWTADGKLLVAGMIPNANQAACFANPGAQCPVAFNVYSIDPATMQAERLFTHEGVELGGGTVAVRLNTDMLIGSCFGERVVSVRDFFKSAAALARQERMP